MGTNNSPGRVAPRIVAALALTVALSGCTIGEKAVTWQTTTEENLANQRKAARAFLSTQSNVDQIRFTQAGGRPGMGVPWCVNAVVTIRGKDYDEILGTGQWSFGGDVLPDPSAPGSFAPAIVIYSDGSEEVFG